jgi:hypothetical protein
MIILHKNVTGLAILSTCHDIATEARFILEPKWRSINSRPIQIIINGFALDGEDFTWLFRCLADSRCAVSNDIRELAYVRRDGYRWSVYGGYIENKYPEECDDSEVDEESDEGEDIKEKENSQTPFSEKTRRVAVYWNQYSKRNNAKLCKTRMGEHKHSIEQTKQQWRDEFMSKDYSAEHRRSLDVVFHTALLNAKEKAVCEVIQPLGEDLHGQLGDDGPLLEIKGGAGIDGDV